MNITQHPGEEYLLDYTAGSLTQGWSLAIATHLTFCSKCRKDTADIEALGGTMLETIETTNLEETTVEQALEKAEQLRGSNNLMSKKTALKEKSLNQIPSLLLPHLHNRKNEVSWKRLGFGINQSLLKTSDRTTTARLLKIPGGRSVLEHSHNGPELTVVLSGKFSDETGTYCKGDFQQADKEVTHRPQTIGQEPCVCLLVTDFPLKFTGSMGRLLQPILRI